MNIRVYMSWMEVANPYMFLDRRTLRLWRGCQSWVSPYRSLQGANRLGCLGKVRVKDSQLFLGSVVEPGRVEPPSPKGPAGVALVQCTGGSILSDKTCRSLLMI